MERCLILYYSGVGNTAAVAYKLYNFLQDARAYDNNYINMSKDTIYEHMECELYSIENLDINLTIEDYDLLIIGFPTIHSHIAKPMYDFLKKLDNVKKQVPTFVYTTCGLYSENALRKAWTLLEEKGLKPVLSRSYRCSSVDAILLLPKISFFQHHEKHLTAKIKEDVDMLLYRKYKRKPFTKWYTVLNFANRSIGFKYKMKIYNHTKACVKCNVCINNCPVDAFTSKDGYPIVDRSRCINCYRCIHNCPTNALSLSKRKQPKVLYKNAKQI